MRATSPRLAAVIDPHLPLGYQDSVNNKRPFIVVNVAFVFAKPSK
jgi:hypothetical protein